MRIMQNKDIDIIKNMKTVEWLKAQLLSSMANIHIALANGDENTKENLEDLISNVILETLLLGRRLGLTYDGIESALRDNIRLNLIEGHKIEKWYGDLSILLEYIDKDKN